MVTILFLVAFGLYSAAQTTTYDCQCGFFVQEQAPGQIGEASPIPLNLETYQVSPDVCLEPTAGHNTCQNLCDDWAAGLVENGWNLCDAPIKKGIERCYGGLYCEGLYQDERLPEAGRFVSSMRTWYRMPQCSEGSGYQSWNMGTYENPEALCCTSSGSYNSCYEECDCIKSESTLNYCECGVFTSVQFQQDDDSDQYQPIPFKLNSTSVGDNPLSFCDNYEGDDPNEVCEEYCSGFGQYYFGTYSLLDSASAQYNVNEEVTFGQLYCSTLRSRQIFLNTYINTELRVWKRAPLCGVPNDGTWIDVFPQQDHPERLCCNEDGEFEYPCYAP